MAEAGGGVTHLVRVLKDTDDMSASLASYLSEQASSATSRDSAAGFAVAFSGGSLPKIAGAALVAAPYKDSVDWAAWRVFYADERCVALDHADSNHLALKTQLLDKLPPGAIPPAQIFTIDAAGSPAEQAAAYEAALRKERPDGALDVVLLGMGEDGHTASLFPGHALLEANDSLVASILDSPKPPPSRITLTYPAIRSAREVAVVAGGAGKASILKDILGGGAPSALPVANAHARDSVLRWFIDEAAAAQLDRASLQSF